jgi:hypothetical protein
MIVDSETNVLWPRNGGKNELRDELKTRGNLRKQNMRPAI